MKAKPAACGCEAGRQAGVGGWVESGSWFLAKAKHQADNY